MEAGMNIFRTFFEKFKRFAVTLRFSILTIFVTFFVLAMLSIIALTYYHFTNSMASISFRLMKHASDSAFFKIVNELTHTKLKCKSAARLFELNVVNPDYLPEVLNFTSNFMINEITLFPSVQSIFWGDETGNFVMSQKNGGDVSEVINRFKKIPTRTIFHYDTFGKVIRTENSYDFSYDPRTRPWYLIAKKAQSTAWVGVYLYRITRYQGISVATPVYKNNHLRGVLNFNIRLDYLRHLIQNIKLSENGVLFIATTTGDLLAYPQLEQFRKSYLTNIRSLNNRPWIIAAFDQYKKTGQKEFKFSYNHQDYLATFQLISNFGPTDWVIGAVVPTADFIGEIRKTQLITVLISLGILILGILVVSSLITRVVNPLKKLTAEIEKIQHFELQETAPIKSRIKEISYIAIALYSMKQGLRSFQKYVPATLVRQLIESGEDARIGGIKKPIAILFSDIADFTRIAEKTDPELLIQYLCEYFDELSRIILSYRGIIDKYIGDAIMAFWGVPLADEQSSQDAAKAALECSRRLNVLNTKWIEEGRPALVTRMGIHLGDAIVGNVGSSERLNYTAIGDAINTANRLQSINKIYGTQIIISQTVYQAIKGQFVTRMVDYILLKGKAVPSYIYELIAEDKNELTYDIDAYSRHFSVGFAAYQQSKWEEAIQEFHLCLQVYPEDRLAKLFILRCENFKVNPVKNWTGVWVPTEK